MSRRWTEIMSKQEMLGYLKEYLKQKGYKKQKQTWYRINQDHIYVLLNVQNSQWDRETYYINLGAGLIRQSTMKNFSSSNSDFQYRMDDGIGIERMKNKLTQWEDMFNSELSVLHYWDYISTPLRSYTLIKADTIEYFNELKRKMESQPG